MRKVTVSRMRERYAQTVLTFRITCVYVFNISCAFSRKKKKKLSARMHGVGSVKMVVIVSVRTFSRYLYFKAAPQILIFMNVLLPVFELLQAEGHCTVSRHHFFLIFTF